MVYDMFLCSGLYVIVFSFDYVNLQVATDCLSLPVEAHSRMSAIHDIVTMLS